MTVCRYFLQGNCRFGDRCRFEHTEPSYQNRNYGRAAQTPFDENRSSRYADHSYSSNYNSFNKPSTNYRYDSPNRYSSNDSAYKPDRNQYNNRYNNEPTYKSDRNQYNYNRYSSDPTYKSDRNQYNDKYYTEGDHDYDPNNAQEKFYKGNAYQRNANDQRYSSNDGYSDNAYGQNRFRWLSSDYKQQKSQFNKSVQSDYQTSTPKSASSFSFKVPESEIKTYQNVASSLNRKLDENDQIFAELIKEDATAWELGEQWPFTCYYPDPSKNAFPGFCDISPEELRFEAYKAKENNSYNAYVQIVNNALLDIKQKRDQLKLHTPELLSIIARIRRGEDLSKESIFAEPLSLFQNETETMISDSPQHAVSNFSFKLPSSDSEIKSSAASFSFKLPSQGASKPTRATSSSLQVTDTENYTPLEQLTESEKEQFSASTFTLGKIPTRAPPRALCF